MLGISFSEFCIILLALFFIVGPRRLTEAAYDIGIWVGQIKSALTQIRQTHLEGLDASVFYDTTTPLNKSLDDLTTPPSSPVGEAQGEGAA